MKQPSIYLTKYWASDAWWSFFVVADSWEGAKAIADARGLGEVVEGVQSVADFNADSVAVKSFSDLLHMGCFLSYVALKSGKATPEEILGDRGVLHEIVHVVTGSFDDKTRDNVNDKIKWLFDLARVTVYPCVSNTV